MHIFRSHIAVLPLTATARSFLSCGLLHQPFNPSHSFIEVHQAILLVSTRSPRLSNNTLQFIDLSLRTTVCTELQIPVLAYISNAFPKSLFLWNDKTYPLLSQLSSSLVLAVSQQFDDTTFIRGETSDFLDDVTDELGALGEVAFCAGGTGLALESGCFLHGKIC